MQNVATRQAVHAENVHDNKKMKKMRLSGGIAQTDDNARKHDRFLFEVYGHLEDITSRDELKYFI